MGKTKYLLDEQSIFLYKHSIPEDSTYFNSTAAPKSSHVIVIWRNYFE